MTEIAQKSEENVVYIGNKPFMNYVTGVVMQFTKKQNKEVVVKARGKFIARAVDVVEVSRRRFLEDQNVFIKDIKISSEDFKNKEGKNVSVSTIEVALSKK
jgi:DNA-binding protein